MINETENTERNEDVQDLVDTLKESCQPKALRAIQKAEGVADRSGIHILKLAGWMAKNTLGSKASRSDTQKLTHEYGLEIFKYLAEAETK